MTVYTRKYPETLGMFVSKLNLSGSGSDLSFSFCSSGSTSAPSPVAGTSTEQSDLLGELY